MFPADKAIVPAARLRTGLATGRESCSLCALHVLFACWCSRRSGPVLERDVRMFLIYVLSTWAAVLAHVYFRTQGFFGTRGRARLVLGIAFFLLGFAYIPLLVIIRMNPADGFIAALALGAAVFVGLVSILWTLLAAFEIVAAVFWLAGRRRVRNASIGTRRVMGGLWWGAAAILAVAGIVSARADPSVTRLQVRVPGAEPGRFVVISDTHLGTISSSGQWRRTLQAARALEPRALLIPGDLIDDGSPRAEKQAAMIREFFPNDPVYIVTGNHEKYAGLDFFERLCRRLRFRLLRGDAELLLPGLAIAGIDDDRGHRNREAVDEALSATEGAVFLLAHRPETADLLRERPGTLVLSGHTHGGQTLPMVLLVGLGNAGFKAGLYRIGQAHLYVSRGAGVWGPPMRLLAPSELVLVEVAAGPQFAVRVKNKNSEK